MDKINEVRRLIGYQLTAADISTCRVGKHEATRQVFAEMVKLKEINSQDLFNRIHRCFEETSHVRPYHDWYHTCCVVEGTIQGLRYHLRSNINELSETQQKEVNSTILAAAFHDAGHTGVKEPDIVNVSRSIMIAHHFLNSTSIHDKGTGPIEVDVALMLETMQSTQYPFKREPLNEYQAIVRDSDLLQILACQPAIRKQIWQLANGPTSKGVALSTDEELFFYRCLSVTGWAPLCERPI